MRRASALTIAFALASGIAQAGVGVSGAQTLEQAVSARSAGLAEADTAGAVGAEAMGSNPAGFAGIGERGHELLALYQGGFAGDRFVSAVYAQRITARLGVGAGVASYNSGPVDELDAAGFTSPVSGQRDIMGSAGFGVYFPEIGLSVGGAGRYLRTQLLEDLTGSALAADAGVRWDSPVPGLVVGASVRNLGTPYTMGTGEESLPKSVRLGAGYSMLAGGEETRITGFAGTTVEDLRPARSPHRFEVLCDAAWRIEEGIISVGGGVEFTFRGVLAVRAGYRGPVKGAPARDGVVALGVGLAAAFLRLDYAAGIGDALALHRVGITLAM